MVVIDRGFDLSGVALVLGTGALMRWVSVGGRLPSMPQMLVPLGLALATFGAIALTILAGPRVISSRHARRMLPRALHDRASRHASAMRERLGSCAAGAS